MPKNVVDSPPPARALSLCRQCNFLEAIMGAMLEELENQAMQLSPKERGELIHRLIVSLDGEPEDTPERIAQARDAEIARRSAEMDAGRTKGIPADEAMTRLRAKALAVRNAG